jgi:hypothetical protein
MNRCPVCGHESVAVNHFGVDQYLCLNFSCLSMWHYIGPKRHKKDFLETADLIDIINAIDELEDFKLEEII